MSDQRYHLVYLEATTENAETLSRELREWMRSEGWSVEAEGAVDRLSSREDAAPADRYGPRLQRLAREQRDNYREDYLTVHDSWQMYTGSEAMEGVWCPNCEQLLGFEDEELSEACDQWWQNRVAPDLACPTCGTTTPLDHWDLDRGLAMGTLAISIELYDENDEFRNALRVRFPGRWAGIYEHI